MKKFLLLAFISSGCATRHFSVKPKTAEGQFLAEGRFVAPTALMLPANAAPLGPSVTQADCERWLKNRDQTAPWAAALAATAGGGAVVAALPPSQGARLGAAGFSVLSAGLSAYLATQLEQDSDSLAKYCDLRETP